MSQQIYNKIEKAITVLEDVQEYSHQLPFDYIDEIFIQFEGILRTLQDTESMKSVQLENIKTHCNHIKDYSEFIEVRKK